MIDTHCHLDVEAFDRDRADVLARAWAAGVSDIIVPAIRPRTWSRVVALATRRAPPATVAASSLAIVDGAPEYPAGAPAGATEEQTNGGVSDRTIGGVVASANRANESRSTVWIALGIHPQVVPELDADERAGDLAARLAAAVVDAGAIAIGECGLDAGTAEHALQETILRAHIRAARETKLPLVLHVMHAHDLAPRILREERAHEVGGILHSYSGSAELVSVYRDLGMVFSFAGPITYENARRPVAAARAVPDELLLAETDSPDQSPADHRGRRNEPALLPSVIAGLAAARGTTTDAIVALTRANARRVFRLGE